MSVASGPGAGEGHFRGPPRVPGFLNLAGQAAGATSDRARRAAQYVRMSTEHQRFSISAQTAAIAEYAEKHSYAVVATYAGNDEAAAKFKSDTGIETRK